MTTFKRGSHWHIDVTVNGIRYREALNTRDKREAAALEKKRVAEIQQGKGASKAGREFARKPTREAIDQFVEDRIPHVSPRTHQLERERSRPLKEFFGDRSLIRITASDIASYQKARLKGEVLFGGAKTLGKKRPVSNRTVNMEVGLLRQVMRRAKTWSIVAEDVSMLRESSGDVAKVLTAEQKRLLFGVAASRDEWLVALCAAVLAVNTTCRGVELKGLRWSNVDLFEQVIHVRRSKTEAGHRDIPLNTDARTALARLLKRAECLGSNQPEHFVFPACERNVIDPTKPQTSWRTAWRKVVKATAKRAGREAALTVLRSGGGLRAAIASYRRAFDSFCRFRFHDLRHQCITELAEAGAPDATIMSVAGHLSRRMLEHYSHVRMQTKRGALSKLESGLMRSEPETGMAEVVAGPMRVN